MQLGDRVEVRTRLDGSWVRGFSIAEVRRNQQAHAMTEEEFMLRRDSDGTVLPAAFPGSDVRPAPVPRRW